MSSSRSPGHYTGKCVGSGDEHLPRFLGVPVDSARPREIIEHAAGAGVLPKRRRGKAAEHEGTIARHEASERVGVAAEHRDGLAGQGAWRVEDALPDRERDLVRVLEERHTQCRQPDELSTGGIPGRLGQRVDEALEPPWLCVVAPAIVRAPPIRIVGSGAVARRAGAHRAGAVPAYIPVGSVLDTGLAEP